MSRDVLFILSHTIGGQYQQKSKLTGKFAFFFLQLFFALHVKSDNYLDVQIVGGKDKLKKSSLVDFEEIAVPAADIIGPLFFVLIVLWWGRIVLVVSSPLDHFFQNGGVDIGKGDNFVLVFFHAEILQHGLDGYRLPGDLYVNGEDFAVTGLKLDGRHI